MGLTASLWVHHSAPSPSALLERARVLLVMGPDLCCAINHCNSENTYMHDEEILKVRTRSPMMELVTVTVMAAVARSIARN